MMRFAAQIGLLDLGRGVRRRGGLAVGEQLGARAGDRLDVGGVRRAERLPADDDLLGDGRRVRLRLGGPRGGRHGGAPAGRPACTSSLRGIALGLVSRSSASGVS